MPLRIYAQQNGEFNLIIFSLFQIQERNDKEKKSYARMFA
jgi:hypothetical protein